MSVGGRAIIFSGGVGHPFGDTSAELVGIVGKHGWFADVLTSLDDAVALLPATDLLVVNALAWSMTQDEKYASQRDAWAFSMNGAQMEAIARHAERGGKLLVMHTGVICFDTQPRWRELIGGGWTWGVSHHPPYGEFTVRLTEAGQALSDGPPLFRLRDEAYHHLEPGPDCTVLATADLGDGPQPIAWTRGSGIAVDALGHDVESLTQPGHRALLDGMLRRLAAA